MSLPATTSLLSTPSSSRSSSTSSGCFLLASTSTDSSSSGSFIEAFTPAGVTISSFHVTSTVKGGGGAGGKVELIAAFGGFLAATFSDNNRLVIYHLPSQTKHNQSTLPERARAMTVDPACRYLLVGSASGRLRTYSLATGLLVSDLKTSHDRGINVLALDQAAKWVVLGGEDGVVSVYDFGTVVGNVATPGASASARKDALIYSISDHSLSITSLQVTASNMLLTAAKDGSVRMYQLEQPVTSASDSSSLSSSSSSPSPPCLFHHSFRGVIHSAILDVTESVVYVALKENIHWLSLYQRGASSHAAPAVWKGHASTILTLALDASSSHLMSLDAEGTVKIWEGNSLSPGSLPSLQGTCLKTLPGRRVGCKTVPFLPGGFAYGSCQIATQNMALAQYPVAKGAGATGLQGKEGSWIFPPLNSNVTATGIPQAGGGSVFLPIQLTAHAAVNLELEHRSHRGGSEANRKRSWVEMARDELHADRRESSFALREDWRFLAGKSGWNMLAEMQANRGASMDALQNQAETYATHAQELYQLCVEKLWTELKTPANCK